ncbi:caspase family protein [Bosea sp. (in: a-proteobacteria)]|uniref:caspase family protein n=1 Tax=Bosea sp. (in: a-proteobacteria) TaxID=1871050 RepID=UPI000A4BF7D8|nr:caspase family protein [Bosea sp. (in: a-proteobacteria)]
MTRYRRFGLQGDEARVDQQPGGGPSVQAPRPTASPEASDGRHDVAPPGSAAEPRLALLIGNSRYKWQDAIDNPVRDVRLIAWALEGLGFTVSRIENAGIAQMQDAVLAFGEALDKAGPESVAVLYFAGHGIQQDGVNFLIPVDAQLPSPRYLAARALALDTVVGELARTDRKATVILLDACRNALPGFEGETGSPTEGLARARLPRPAQLVYSTAAQAMSSDGAEENSPFAQALADELPSLLTPGRKIQDAVDDVAAKVSLATAGEQTVATYREGVLLPLALTAQDEARLRDWSKRPPYRLGRRQILLRTMAAAVAVIAVAGAALWLGAYPETRTTWLLRAGLLDRTGYDFACEPPWDGPADRYGLTRRHWCLTLDDSSLTGKVAADAPAKEVAAGFAQGDPKALYLTALRTAIEVRSLSGPQRTARAAEAQALAARVARTDLPRGGIAPYIVGGHWLIAETSIVTLRRDVEAARSRGVLLATLLIAVIDNDQRAVGLELTAAAAADAIEAALRRLEENDPSGQTADLAARIFSGRDATWVDLASPERERFWLRRAAFAGYAPAAAEVLDRARRDPAYALAKAERDRLHAVVTAQDDPRGLYWRAQARGAAGGATDDDETIALVTRAAEGGYIPAIMELVDLHLYGSPRRKPDLDRAIHWLERGSALGDVEAIGRLGAIWARGLAAPDGSARLAARPDEARRLLERPEVAADPRAMMSLAALLRYGPMDRRDPARAEALVRQIEARLPYPEIISAARDESRRIRIERALALAVEPAMGIARGRPEAPVTLSLALSPSCPECALATELAPFNDLVTRGQLRIVILPVWDDNDAADTEATLVTVCAAREARLAVFTRLVERREAWATVTDPTLRRQALAAAITDLVGRPPDIDVCLADQAAKTALQRQRDSLVRSLDVRDLRATFVGGHRLDFYLPEDLLAAVKAQLPPDAAAPRQ